jgi:dienelactone hydrolase
MRSLITICWLFLLITTALAGSKAITYEIEGRQYLGYYVSPAKNAPLILLIHDWDGLNDYEIKRSEMLAQMGYAVFAADLFGKGVHPQTVEEKRRLTGELYANRDRMRTLLQGALKTAEDQGANIWNAVAIGYCFGGTAVLELARSGADLRGFVIFHGGLKTPEGQDYSRTLGKILVFHGTADKNVPMEDFGALARELEKANVPHEMTTYGGAPHAFTVFGSSNYRKDVDKKSWRRFVEFLQETFD